MCSTWNKNIKAMEINYFFEDVDVFSINETIEEKINKACSDEKKQAGSISYIFCSDAYLLNMNKDFLSHDYYTDIITFDYTENDIISGDIFISTERVEDNSGTYGVSFLNELERVMIHGVLHLLGYKDATEEEKRIMRMKEEDYISKDKDQ